MKTVVHDENARDKTLHIISAGCIVNICVGLSNDEGKVTSVEILPDLYSGEEWHLADGSKYANVRVLEGKAEEPRFVISDNKIDGARREIYLEYRGQRWTLYFEGAGLAWHAYVKLGETPIFLGKYESINTNNFGSSRAMWGKRYTDMTEKAETEIKNLYRLIAGG